MSVAAALDALHAAYAARDAAREHALAAVDWQFAAIIARRKQEHALAQAAARQH
jgi:hypothetical protein